MQISYQIIDQKPGRFPSFFLSSYKSLFAFFF